MVFLAYRAAADIKQSEAATAILDDQLRVAESPGRRSDPGGR